MPYDGHLTETGEGSDSGGESESDCWPTGIRVVPEYAPGEWHELLPITDVHEARCVTRQTHLRSWTYRARRRDWQLILDREAKYKHWPQWARLSPRTRWSHRHIARAMRPWADTGDPVFHG